jgi:hypothetical protein
MKPFILALLAFPTFAQPAYDANTANSNHVDASSVTITVAMGAAGATAGHLIGFCGSFNQTGAYTAPTLIDTVGTTYTKVSGPTSETGSTNGWLETWIGCANATGANALVWTSGTAMGLLRVAVAQYSNVPCGSSPLDKTATPGTGTGSTALATSPTATTSQASELLFSCSRKFNTGATLSAGTGYTSRADTNSVRDGVFLEDQTVNATGAYTGLATASTNTTWTIQLVTLKGPASAATVKHKASQQ